jgi:uncharacterized protein (DUF1800 family)
MNDWSIEDAAHLMRRAGFGGFQESIEALHAVGKDAAIEYLLNYENVDDPAAAASYQLVPDLSNAGNAIGWLLYRMIATTRPLQEKLTWFWHGHFTSALSKVPPQLMVIQNETWRKNANGSFSKFLKDMYKDPAMLIYLDNNTNFKGAPNENFARELMELFTMGIGNYTEKDIKEAARALTGWVVYPDNYTVGTFVSSLHDYGYKTVLGRRGRFDGDDIMDIVYRHPATAPYICTKLYQFFAGPNPSQRDIDSLTRTWKYRRGNIKEVMRTLFNLNSFWSEENRGALVKSPVEYIVGLIQRWQIDNDQVLAGLGQALAIMGQVPFNPPHVAGYPENLEWAGTSPLLARYNSANAVLYSGESNDVIATMIAGADVSTAENLINTLIARMSPIQLTQATRDAITTYVDPATYNATDYEVAVKARGILHLIASSAEYQVN